MGYHHRKGLLKPNAFLPLFLIPTFPVSTWVTHDLFQFLQEVAECFVCSIL